MKAISGRAVNNTTKRTLMKARQILILVSLLWAMAGGAQIETRHSLWGKGRGEFSLPSGLQVPFNFDIAKGRDGQPTLYFINGDERFEAGTVQKKKDSLSVNLDLFGNVLVFNPGVDRARF